MQKTDISTAEKNTLTSNMTPFLIAFILSSVLAVTAVSLNAVSLFGGILAWILCTAMSWLGGLSLFLTISTVLLITVACAKYAGKKADPFRLRKKHGRRGAERILCNIGIAGLMCMIYGLTANRVFLISCYTALAESLSDSVASKIGPLTKGKTIDLCTLKPADVGISGGISIQGTLTAFAGSLIIGIIYFIFNRNFSDFIFITICGFVGCMCDSFLGSLFQLKYKCPKCSRLTESQYHCDTYTEYFKGIKVLNNDLVNLLSNASAALLALILVVIIK